MPKTFVALLVAGLASTAAFAYDSDPGYGPRGEAGQSGARKTRGSASVYYKPTMRYYGKGYTVAYRYVQTNNKQVRGTTSFEREQLYLPVSSVEAIVGSAPRLTYFYGGAKPATQPQLQAPIVDARSVVTAPVKELPPIAEKLKP